MIKGREASDVDGAKPPRFLTTLSMAGAAGLLGVPRALGAEGALETTTVRLTKGPGIWLAPQYVAIVPRATAA